MWTTRRFCRATSHTPAHSHKNILPPNHPLQKSFGTEGLNIFIFQDLQDFALLHRAKLQKFSKFAKFFQNFARLHENKSDSISRITNTWRIFDGPFSAVSAPPIARIGAFVSANLRIFLKFQKTRAVQHCQNLVDLQKCRKLKWRFGRQHQCSYSRERASESSVVVSADRAGAVCLLVRSLAGLHSLELVVYIFKASLCT